MLINFSIQNFTSVKDKITLSFEATNSKDLEEYYIIEPIKNLRLLKIGLIYGANASGKTTILKALDFLKNITVNPFDKKTEIFDFSPFLFDKETPNQNTIFEIEFLQNETKYLYEVEFNKNAIVREQLDFYKPRKANVFTRETNLEKQLSSIKFGSKIKINKSHKSVLEANTLWNNTVFGAYQKTNFESEELQDACDWFGLKLKSIIQPRTNLLSYISNKIENNEINKSSVIELLKKADFCISDIIIKKEEKNVDDNLISLIKTLPISDEQKEEIDKTGKLETKKIYFNHEVESNNYELSYEKESEGTKRYYQFSGLLDFMLRNEIVFPVDEIESSLHPDLLKHFLLSFLVNSKRSQLIATTHHRELLMERDILRNDAIWFTEKQENASTDLFSLADFDSSVIRKDTSSIYNAYKIGKLGATPNLSDYYINLEDGKES